MSRLAALALLFVSACNAYSDSEFIGEYERLYCESYALCASDEMARTVNEKECLEYLRYQRYPVDNNECKYNSDAAESCVTDLGKSGCTGDEPEIPLICEDVFSKCAIPHVPKPSDPPIRPAD